eukprot:6192469-Pleurochrysis_carterae.AAC.4
MASHAAVLAAKSHSGAAKHFDGAPRRLTPEEQAYEGVTAGRMGTNVHGRASVATELLATRHIMAGQEYFHSRQVLASPHQITWTRNRPNEPQETHVWFEPQQVLAATYDTTSHTVLIDAVQLYCGLGGESAQKFD